MVMCRKAKTWFGILYVTDMKQKRFMRMNELGKFSTGTLKWDMEKVNTILSKDFHREKRLDDDQ